MAVQSSKYYAIMMHTFPFELGKEEKIGLFSTRALAEKAVNLVHTTFHGHFNTDIYLGVKKYKNEIIDTGWGLRLKNPQREELTLITTTLTKAEINRIIETVSSKADHRLTESASLTNSIEGLGRARKGVYYSVVLNFRPLDGSRKLIAGYYQFEKTACEVLNLISRPHRYTKMGLPFDISIEPCREKFVESVFGKRYHMVDRAVQEIKPSYDPDECTRLGKIIGEAMKIWSPEHLENLFFPSS